MKLIDSEALIEGCKLCIETVNDTPTILIARTFMKIIEKQPIIEERKTGRWINCRNDDGHNIADCGVCGNTIQWFDGDEKPRFCCMCGAMMENG